MNSTEIYGLWREKKADIAAKKTLEHSLLEDLADIRREIALLEAEAAQLAQDGDAAWVREHP